MIKRAADWVRWLLLTGTVGVNAFADEPPKIELSWSAPVGCPKEAAVLAKSRELVRNDATRSVSARATIRPQPSGFELVLETGAGEGDLSRTLVARSCSELADAAALILAMASRPRRPLFAEGEQSEAPPKASETAAPGATPIRHEPATAKRGREIKPPIASARLRPRKERLRLGAVASGQADFGTLPNPTLAIGGGLIASWRHVTLEATARQWISRQEEVEPNKGGELSVTAGTLLGCLAAPMGLSACAGGEAGRLRGEGYREGIIITEEQSVFWAAGILGGRLNFVTGRWFFAGASIEAAIPVRHYRFRLNLSGVEQTVHETPTACFRAGLHLGLLIPARD